MTEEAEKVCRFLEETASKFEVGSYEEISLLTAIDVLLKRDVLEVRPAYEAFCKTHQFGEKFGTECEAWLVKNPTSSCGQMALILGKLFVVCESLSKGKYLAEFQDL